MKTLIKALAIIIVSMGLAACASSGGQSGASGGFNPLKSSEPVSLPADNQFGYTADNTLATDQLLSLRSYHFKFNSVDVIGVNLQAVKAQGIYLSGHPELTVLLEGNTDIRGSREYNIGLGWRRAQAVSRVLMSEGVAQQQIRMVSYGAEKPVAMGNTNDDYAKNRRVDLLYCQDSSCSSVYSSDGLKSDF
tara:strand:- start:64350 stop:64922 length:573 start_codon:yes stop_codon:yes gene_type:complete